jgi:hypothetical protein
MFVNFRDEISVKHISTIFKYLVEIYNVSYYLKCTISCSVAFRQPIRERQAHQLEKFINDDVIGFAKYSLTLFYIAKITCILKTTL